MSLSTGRSFLMAAYFVAIASAPCAHAQTSDAEWGAKALFYNTSGAVVSVESAAASSSTVASAERIRPGQAKPSNPTVLALRASALLVAADGGTQAAFWTY